MCSLTSQHLRLCCYYCALIATQKYVHRGWLMRLVCVWVGGSGLQWCGREGEGNGHTYVCTYVCINVCTYSIGKPEEEWTNGMVKYVRT